MSDSSSDSDISSEDEDISLILLSYMAIEESDYDLVKLVLSLLRCKRKGLPIPPIYDIASDDEESTVEDEPYQVDPAASRATASATYQATSQHATSATQKNIPQVSNPPTKSGNTSKLKVIAQRANLSMQKPVATGTHTAKTYPVPQQSSTPTNKTTAQYISSKLHGSSLPNRLSVNKHYQSPIPATQVSNLTIANLASHNARYCNRTSIPKHPLSSVAQTSNVPAVDPRARNANLRIQKDAATGARFSAQVISNEHKFKTSDESKPSTSATSKRKRPAGIGEEKKKKGRPMKIVKTAETEGSDGEECLQDPFDDMIEIEEPRIKVEALEEFNETRNEEEISPNNKSTTDNVGFEAVFCNPDIVKEECQDDIETPDTYKETDPEIVVPDVFCTSIKVEPPEEMSEAEVGYDEKELQWRCPLVSCPEMFITELEMYRHLNLDHVVKGLPPLSKSKQVSEPRSVTTKELPSKPTVISTSPAEAISGGSGLAFYTSASSLTSTVTVSTASTPVTTCQSVPSGSSGPVTTTTTVSYSSIVPSSTPLLTCSSVPSVSSCILTTSSSPCVPVTLASSDSTSCPHDSTMTPGFSVSPSVTATTCSTSHSLDALSTTCTSQGVTKLIVAPISEKASSSTGPKNFLQNLVTKPSQPLQIFQPSQHTIEELPPCATDESDLFSISLARFPENRRVPIKRKLLDVINCVEQKNISAESIIIAYYENSSNSRTM